MNNHLRIAAEFCKEARLSAGFTKRELARRVGTSHTAIYRIEKGVGKNGPTIRVLARIADECGIRLRI